MRELQSALTDAKLGVKRNAKSLLVTPSLLKEKIPLVFHLTAEQVALRAPENGVRAPKKLSGKTLSFLHEKSGLRLNAVVKGGRVVGIRVPWHEGELFRGDRLALIRFLHRALTSPALSLKEELQLHGFQKIELREDGTIHIPFSLVFKRLPHIKIITVSPLLKLVRGQTTEIRLPGTKPNEKGDLLVSFDITPKDTISSATIHKTEDYENYPMSFGAELRDIFRQFKIPGESTSVTKVRKFFKTKWKFEC